MIEYTKYTLEDGSTILIETETPHRGGGPVGMEANVKTTLKWKKKNAPGKNDA